jgi:hypothetical protein
MQGRPCGRPVGGRTQWHAAGKSGDHKGRPYGASTLARDTEKLQSFHAGRTQVVDRIR